MDDVTALIGRLIDQGTVPAESIVGCTKEEIEAVRVDQGVSRLPGSFESFLNRAGRGAGLLLRGTHAFFPQILGLKAAARDLLADGEASLDLGPDALVIAMHQGYQVFWFPTVVVDEPNVLMYQEGDRSPRMVWGNFVDYLRDMVAEIDHR